MRKLLSEYSRGTSFKGTYNLVRRFFRCGFNKQVNVVGLDCQSQNRPTVFIRHFKGNARFHPNAKAQGFPAPESYKIMVASSNAVSIQTLKRGPGQTTLLLSSLTTEIRARIKEQEGVVSALVLADFREDLERQMNRREQIRRCYVWLLLLKGTPA